MPHRGALKKIRAIHTLFRVIPGSIRPPAILLILLIQVILIQTILRALGVSAVNPFPIPEDCLLDIGA